MRLIPPELFRQRAEDGVAEVVVAEPEWHCDSGREAIIGCPVGAISEESR